MTTVADPGCRISRPFGGAGITDDPWNEFVGFTSDEIEQIRQAGLILAAFAGRPEWLTAGQAEMDKARRILGNATSRGVTVDQLAAALVQPRATICVLLADTTT